MRRRYANNGYLDERVYRIYYNMKNRCYLNTFANYKYYGGSGVKVCDEWLGKDGYKTFYDWAKLNGYNKELNLCRKDKFLDYCPSNCSWSLKKETNENNKRSRYYTYNGETMTISKWAKRYNLQRCVLNNRLRRGWSFENAISTDTRRYN